MGKSGPPLDIFRTLSLVARTTDRPDRETRDNHSYEPLRSLNNLHLYRNRPDQKLIVDVCAWLSVLPGGSHTQAMAIA
jgi:hypothetical protein